MNEEKTEQETQGMANVPAVREPNQLVQITLPKEHQRFYDKLRRKIEQFVREKGMSDKTAEYLLLAPDLFVLLSRLVLDKRVPFQAKAVAGAAVAYFLSPIDVIPEVLTGPLGFLDDVVLAVYALRRILVDVDRSIVYEHWNGQQDLLQTITRIIESADDLVGKKVLSKLERKLTDSLRK
ncbi:DUF1232 domain-containing protein [Brevibacillus humidisoli]|uniref:YkvA family protein n=1 Tax=Brevibacillus humidisoli TaxID=2895522 RepID=UPI001E2CA792|nr:DUF1232 domain-containing protein [Brevibacillus humidisoli]UFJ41640.1 DUF1232 domain-containing protein [Brevibacillus humidisoli]